MVYVLYASFPCSDISTSESKSSHAGQSQFSEVALLHTTGDQRHGDVSLDAVDPHPGGNQRQDPAIARSVMRHRSVLSICHRHMLPIVCCDVPQEAWQQRSVCTWKSTGQVHCSDTGCANVLAPTEV